MIGTILIRLREVYICSLIFIIMSQLNNNSFPRNLYAIYNCDNLLGAKEVLVN